MKDLIIPALIGLFALVCAFFIPLKPASNATQAAIRAGTAGTFAEVYETNSKSDYTLCGVAMRPDSEVILVSPDLGKCGDSMTVVLVDGSVISAPISGILRHTHDKRVEVYSLETPQVTQVYKH